jgi:hypothetical protein
MSITPKSLLAVTQNADERVTECADDRSVKTAPLGLVRGAVVGDVAA